MKEIIIEKENPQRGNLWIDNKVFSVNVTGEEEVTVKSNLGDNILEMSKLVSRLFSPETNFIIKMKEVFGVTINMIYLDFQKVTVCASKEQHEWHDIYTKYNVYIDGHRFSNSTAVRIDEDSKMEFFEPAGKENWEKKSESENLKLPIFNFARRWAKVMQHYMEEDNRFRKVAEYSLLLSNLENFSGKEVYEAVCLLESCWKYGFNLRKYWESGYEDY